VHVYTSLEAVADSTAALLGVELLQELKVKTKETASTAIKIDFFISRRIIV
jgi:hypothetical protein